MGSGNIKINKKNIERDLKKYIDNMSKSFAINAANEITGKTKSVLEDFYLSYHPDYYSRSMDLYRNSYKRYYRNSGKDYFGGVILSPNNMHDYNNNFSLYHKSLANSTISSNTQKEDVFRWTWLDGYHGYHWTGNLYGKKQRNIAPIQTDSPIALLIEKVYDKPFYETLKNNSIKEARKQRYKYLEFD